MLRSRTIAAALLDATLLTTSAARAETIERHFRARPARSTPRGLTGGD